MHTAPVDDNGTDLPVVAKTLCPEYKVYFSDKKFQILSTEYTELIPCVLISRKDERIYRD